MKPLDAAARLELRLEREGIAYERGRHEVAGRGEDWQAVWEAFCTEAREPAEEPFEKNGHRLHIADFVDNDLLLHESGDYQTSFWVLFRRQFSFADEDGDYAGMNMVALEFQCDRAPDGRVPKAQRWGYAGARRAEVSDDAHPEMERWAGWVDSWKQAVEASKSFQALAEIGPVRWILSQSDI